MRHAKVPCYIVYIMCQYFSLIENLGEHSHVCEEFYSRIMEILECNKLKVQLVQIDDTIHCINMVLKTNQCALG